MLLVTKWFGTFLVDEGKVVKHQLFPKEPAEIARRLESIDNKDVLEEEKKLAKGMDGLKVTERRLQPLGALVSEDMDFIPPEEFGFSNELLHEAMLEYARTRSKGSVSEDMYIVQAVNAIDDQIHIANLMSERLHEWYGFHFPELSSLVKEEKFVELIAVHGGRDKIMETLNLEQESIGSEISRVDIEPLMEYASALSQIYETRKNLDAYLKERMNEVAPNLNEVVGPIIGARLIALSSGLEKLARRPSGTVQLLGAEKALFRHLKDGSNPPKHGVIFQHPTVHRAPYWQRGKIARAFASKISIAARLDWNKGEFMGDTLKRDLERRVEEIKKKYPDPPRRKSSKRNKWQGKGKTGGGKGKRSKGKKRRSKGKRR